MAKDLTKRFCKCGGQTIALLVMVRQCQLIPEAYALLLNLCLIAGVSATGWDCCCGLERGGHCFEPIRKKRGLSQNQALS